VFGFVIYTEASAQASKWLSWLIPSGQDPAAPVQVQEAEPEDSGLKTARSRVPDEAYYISPAMCGCWNWQRCDYLVILNGITGNCSRWDYLLHSWNLAG
jgi:hypothetical protein